MLPIRISRWFPVRVDWHTFCAVNRRALGVITTTISSSIMSASAVIMPKYFVRASRSRSLIKIAATASGSTAGRSNSQPRLDPEITSGSGDRNIHLSRKITKEKHGKNIETILMELQNLHEKIRAMAEVSLAVKGRFFEKSEADVARAAQMIIEAMRAGGKLLIFGNGGSAADAQHIASELAFKMGRERAALPALALTTDTSLLTAISNDSNFDFVFARQIQALGRKGDIVLAISTSGNSANVIEALKEAHAREIRSIGLLGAGGGKAASFVDLALIVPHDDTPRIQEVHIVIGHIVCRLIEDELCPN